VSRRAGVPPDFGEVPANDEVLARTALVGSLAHRAIVELLAQGAGNSPGLPAVMTGELALLTADGLLGAASVQTRALRQVLAGAICGYFWHLLPPSPWSFLAGEHPLRPGRVDVLWAEPGGRVLIDEIKTGRSGVDLAATAAQARRYLNAGALQFGAALVGVRVLCPADPPRSWLCRPGAGPLPLSQTPYLREPPLGTILSGPRSRRRAGPDLGGRPVRGDRGPPRPVAASGGGRLPR
jgi:hypothetical protein